MRRPGGGGSHYSADSSAGGGYAAAPPPPHMQQQLNKVDHHSQWRWERDVSKIQSPMATHTFDEGQGSEASRSYYQGQRPDPRAVHEKQGSHDTRSQPCGEEIDARYEENDMFQTFEVLEQKFLYDIRKLSKEQSDAEDAEIARHRETINAINAQYQEQLVSLRARHASRRDEFLRREFHSRQQQYQQAAVDLYPGRSIGSSDPQGYSAVAAASREPYRPYNADNHNSYRERERFLGNVRNQDLEPRVQYPGGRVYNTGSRYN